MDTRQLKLLAGRLRGLVEQRHHFLTHSQALDLIASVAGLRNWPEVTAFPERVADCDLTQATVCRLVKRLRSRVGLHFEATILLEGLRLPSPADDPEEQKLELWPDGPDSGVYVTTSQNAINALLARYEEATDGAPLYAERAGGSSESTIHLGEDGLWSQGLRRVPSGTLIVVGPVEMTQESWAQNAERLQMACLQALNSGHRVAVLFDTPAPEHLHADALLLVQSDEPNIDDLHDAFKGVVGEDGQLKLVVPFVKSRPAPVPFRRLRQ